MSLVELPEVLTVEEAAKVLRIGRSAAYELARRFRDSGGKEGLPVVMLGRSLRVPKHALQRLLEDPAALFASPSPPGRLVRLADGRREHS